MRVLWWLPEFPPDIGGIGTFAKIITSALKSKSVYPSIFVSKGGPSLDNEEGLSVKRLPVHQSICNRDIRSLAQMQNQLTDYKKLIKPDLYHVSFTEPSLIMHMKTIDVEPAPMVLTLHSEMFNVLSQHGSNSLFGKLLERANIITTVSSASATVLAKQCPEFATKIVVIPNATKIGNEPEKPTEDHKILFAGRLVEQKGIDRLIRAMPLVLESVPNVNLVIAGVGPEESKLRMLAEKLDVDSCISFVGGLNKAELSGQFNKCRVVVMPSRFEGMPYVALEAGERGRAVVATDIGGIDEVVKDGITGLLVDSIDLDNDASPLAQAIIRVLLEKNLAEDLGARARRHVNNNFSVETCASQYKIAYVAAIKKNKPKISVIMPAWNAQEFIEEAIVSVVNQSEDDFEIIVVDDGSTDSTIKCVLAINDPRITILRQPHRGVGPARNAGIAICTGKYIAHIDADDRWPVDRLKNLIEPLDSCNELDAVFGNAVEFADSSAPKLAKIFDTPMAVRMPTCGLIRNVSHIKRIPFAPIPSGDQIQWICDALLEKIQYKIIDEIVLERRIHSKNNSHRYPFNKDSGRLQMMRSILEKKRTNRSLEA